jgi:predicted PurR-regulated permease PerM
MTGNFIERLGGKPARFSYFFIAGTLILAGMLHLGTPLVVALFSYFALTKLHFRKRVSKWLAVALFMVLIFGVTYGLVHFLRDTVRALPEIADKAIPSVIQFAREYKVELAFTDYDSLKESAVAMAKSQAEYWRSAARFAGSAGKQLMFFLVGVVVAIALFVKPGIEASQDRPSGGNLYSLCCQQIALRFETLFTSFARVMGAQILISTINTVLTTIFVIAVDLPYAIVVVGVTFLCGLVPVIGNLISNTIIVSIGFTVSPRMAFAALIFLIVIHKMEYFLNSKIIGDRIRSPLWLTLLGLVVGERLMGIPGMILAPVVLNYIRVEASAIKSASPANETPLKKEECELEHSPG